MHILPIFTLLSSAMLAVLSEVARENNCSTEQTEFASYFDRETFGVALLQNHMRLQSASSPSMDTEGRSLESVSRQSEFHRRKSHSNLLILIVTCHKHSYNWWSLIQWAEEVHPHGLALLLVGRPPDTDTIMDKSYELAWENRTLMVNTSDTYEALATKMVAGYKAIFEEPTLFKVTYVYKIDDTSIPGDLVDYNITGFNGTQVQESLASQPGDFLTSEFGYTAYDCEKIKAHNPKLMQWHLDRAGDPLSETNYWYNRSQPCNWVFTFGNGAFGYMLSRRALGLISKHWQSMDELYYQFVYEDMAIGVTLAKEGLQPTPVHLVGHMPWNSHVCPCSPPYPDKACDSYCEAHKTHRCCHTACREHAGLCADVVYA